MLLVIKTDSIKVAEGVVLNAKGEKILAEFKKISKAQERKDLTQCLCLEPWNEQDTIEDILDEGKYEFYSTNPVASEMFELLDELWKMARPMLFDKSDILATVC